MSDHRFLVRFVAWSAQTNGSVTFNKDESGWECKTSCVQRRSRWLQWTCLSVQTSRWRLGSCLPSWATSAPNLQPSPSVEGYASRRGFSFLHRVDLIIIASHPHRESIWRRSGVCRWKSISSRSPSPTGSYTFFLLWGKTTSLHTRAVNKSNKIICLCEKVCQTVYTNSRNDSL